MFSNFVGLGLKGLSQCQFYLLNKFKLDDKYNYLYYPHTITCPAIEPTPVLPLLLNYFKLFNFCMHSMLKPFSVLDEHVCSNLNKKLNLDIQFSWQQKQYGLNNVCILFTKNSQDLNLPALYNRS